MLYISRTYLIIILLGLAHTIESNFKHEKRFWFSLGKEKLKQAKPIEENPIYIDPTLMTSFHSFILQYLTRQKQNQLPQDQYEMDEQHLKSHYMMWLEKEMKRIEMKHFWLLRQG